MNTLKLSGVVCALACASFAQAQTGSNDWFHSDYAVSKSHGVNTAKAYQLVAGRTPKEVVVAVIDGGVDIYHEDLVDVLWVNTDEIPGNGIDDDNNGYIDDINGWNFIGGKDGRNVGPDTYEMTRLCAKYSAQFAGKDPKSLKGNEKKEYELYKKLEAEINGNLMEAELALATYIDPVLEPVTRLKNEMDARGYEELTPAAIESFKSDEDLYKLAKNLKDNLGVTGHIDAYEQLMEGSKYYRGQIDHSFNMAFDPRDIVGDDYSNAAERGYGNSDVKGPDASHGTHVAGIIAAKRGNAIGMDGIADFAKIMCIRVVPDGDERDKDVANAIRYAADNGAKIINMSFGKGYSWNKAIVDEAVQYAVSKGVLLIHAAGNESQNTDKEVRFPNAAYEAGGTCPLWINVGAMGWDAAPYLTGDFSNYGKKTVDLFAPGVDIYSTTPENTYAAFNGTSMASPVVAGCAAMLWSYFPNLSTAQVREILLKSVVKPKDKTVIPGTAKEVPFKNLSKTGGVVNLAAAVQLALTY